MKISLFSALSIMMMAAAASAQPVPGSDMYPVSKRGSWGYMNQEGKLVIAPQYQAADYFYEGLAAVKLDNKWGFINPRNKMVIEPEADTVQRFSEGWCAVGHRDEEGFLRWTYINTTGASLPGNEITGLQLVTPFSNNRAMVSLEGIDDPFFISRQGQRVISQGEVYFFTDDHNNRFREGLLKAMKAVKTDVEGMYETVFIDTAGRILDQFRLNYPATGAFREGMMWFMKDLKYGFIDHSGREVIKAQYDTVMDFSEGWACVWTGMDFNPNSGRLEGGKSGYINTLGEWVLEPKVRNSYSFHNGYARVFEKGKWGYMNTSGTMIIPAEYDEAEDFFRGFARAKKEGRWHYINTAAKIIWQEPTD